MKIGFVSLGCPKNQLDAEVMLHELVMAGYEITADETEADVVIINTCGFIESAKKEAIDNILDIAWLKENRSLRGLVVTGCLAQRLTQFNHKENHGGQADKANQGQNRVDGHQDDERAHKLYQRDK